MASDGPSRDADPTIEIRLAFSCGCSESWLVYQLGAEDAEHRIDLPCPSDCRWCAQNGPCAARQTMAPIHEPVAWSEVQPVRRRYQRMKATA